MRTTTWPAPPFSVATAAPATELPLLASMVARAVADFSAPAAGMAPTAREKEPTMMKKFRLVIKRLLLTSLDGFYVALGYGNNWLGSPSDVGEEKPWSPSAQDGPQLPLHPYTPRQSPLYPHSPRQFPLRPFSVWRGRSSSRGHHMNSRDSSSSFPSSACDSVTSSAPAFSSACCGRLAPGITTTVSPWNWQSHASATWPAVAPCAVAIVLSSSTSRRLRSSPFALNALIHLRGPGRVFTKPGSSWYLPVSRPCASGEYAMIVTPSAFAAATVPSDSTRRLSKLYRTWFDASGILRVANASWARRI